MTQLVRHNEHLAQNRQMILKRALAAGLVGLAPVPVLDDWLASRVRRGAVKKIAESRRVDVDANALRAIADGTTEPPSWKAVLRTPWPALFLRKAWRRALVVLQLGRRASEVSRTFARLTLFDHYCARVHVGPGLDGDGGYEVRAAIDEALASTGGTILTRLVRRALLRTAKAAVKAPVDVVDAVTGGALRKVLSRGDEAEAERMVEDAVTRAEGDPTGFLARATRMVEEGVADVERSYVADLIQIFEPKVRARRGIL